MNKKLEELTRREIRYLCFRLQTEAEGGNKAQKEDSGIMSHVELVKDHMEEQEYFGGWKNFAKTWDVDGISPLVITRRTSSIYSEWNKVLKQQAQPLPVQPKTKKLLTNKLSEKVQAKKENIKRKRATFKI